MGRIAAYRLFIAVFVLTGAFLLWSLFYPLAVAWRFDPKMASEGSSRWALLQSLNAHMSLSSLFISADHFYRRLMFPDLFPHAGI